MHDHLFDFGVAHGISLITRCVLHFFYLAVDGVFVQDVEHAPLAVHETVHDHLLDSGVARGVLHFLDLAVDGVFVQDVKHAPLAVHETMHDHLFDFGVARGVLHFFNLAVDSILVQSMEHAPFSFHETMQHHHFRLGTALLLLLGQRLGAEIRDASAFRMQGPSQPTAIQRMLVPIQGERRNQAFCIVPFRARHTSRRLCLLFEAFFLGDRRRVPFVKPMSHSCLHPAPHNAFGGRNEHVSAHFLLFASKVSHLGGEFLRELIAQSIKLSLAHIVTFL